MFMSQQSTGMSIKDPKLYVVKHSNISDRNRIFIILLFLCSVLFDSLTDDMMMSIVDPEKGKIWACNQCGKQSKNKTNLQHHAEATHIPEQAIRYNCHLCGLTKGTFKAMMKHHYKDHREAILKNSTSAKFIGI